MSTYKDDIPIMRSFPAKGIYGRLY